MSISSISLSSTSALSRLPHHHHHHHHHHQLCFPLLSPPPRLHFHFQLHLLRTFPSLHASRRQEGDELFNESRKWNRFDFDNYGDYDDDDEDDEEEDRSLDLLVRFVENIFRKISKRARKAVRSVLPLAISTKLVVCTLGSVVFVSILLIRGVWSGVLYLQENRSRLNGFDEDHPAWNEAEPVT